LAYPYPSQESGRRVSSRPGFYQGDRLLTTREVADILALSPETVLRRWRAGELPGYRLASNVLRFRESEIEAWLELVRVQRTLVGVRTEEYAP
jgi:excisionase family DNA binding protein